ncbi:MAG: sulfite exporter TauE/SafE family protein [Gammaproteobacteria bacterium]|nr:sulfite exporter TauE/SafE family protein [Gammaproteobacteria bacterium]
MPDVALLIPADLSVAGTLFLLICSALTSAITASMGAGGGVLLRVIMALMLPPAAIIPVHGLVQVGSNLGRVVMTWREVDWPLIALLAPATLLGAVLGNAVLVAVPAVVWQVGIALFVLYACWGPPLPGIVLGRPGLFLAGVATSFLSLFIGSTGPVLAALFKQMYTSRFRTVSTFAAAMTLQHAPKALVFAAAGFIFQEWALFILAMILTGALGTGLGLHLLKRMTDQRFNHVFNLLLTLLALRLLWQALVS